VQGTAIVASRGRNGSWISLDFRCTRNKFGIVSGGRRPSRTRGEPKSLAYFAAIAMRARVPSTPSRVVHQPEKSFVSRRSSALKRAK